MLKLKLPYFGHLMWRADSLEKTLMLQKNKGGRRGRQRMRWLDGITDSMDMSLSSLRDGQGGLVCCNPLGCRVGHDWATELNWTFLLPVILLLSPLPPSPALPSFLSYNFTKQEKNSKSLYSIFGTSKILLCFFLSLEDNSGQHILHLSFLFSLIHFTDI